MILRIGIPRKYEKMDFNLMAESAQYLVSNYTPLELKGAHKERQKEM